MTKHIVLTEAELARRSEVSPPLDGGRSEAQRERMSVLSREHTTERVQCEGRCGRFVWAQGLCHDCDGMCDAVRLA